MRIQLHQRVWPLLLAAGMLTATVFAASAQQTNASSRIDYSSFKLITDRNIFDPNRRPHNSTYVPRSEPKPSRTSEIFSLVGVMSYEKGTFAVFDGTSSEYRQILQLNQSIAGYLVTNIEPDQVTLVAGTNQVELPVGTQMRRTEDGGWMVSANTGPISASSDRGYASRSSSYHNDSSSTTTSTATAAPAGDSAAANDILQKMMQRREQELNR